MFCYTIREIKYLLSLRRDKRDLEAFARGSRLLRTRTDPSALGARPSMSYDGVSNTLLSRVEAQNVLNGNGMGKYMRMST